MIYRPETGLSDSNHLKISHRTDGTFETCWQGNGSAGNFSFHQVNVREGLDIWRFEHMLTRPLSIRSQGIQPVVAFRFCLRGGAFGYHVAQDRHLDMKAGQQALSYAVDTENVSSLPADIPLDMVCILVSPAYLMNWLGSDVNVMSDKLRAALDGKNNGVVWHTREMTRVVEDALGRMIYCPYTGMTRKLFFESCSLELMCHQLETIRSGPDRSGAAPGAGCRLPHPEECKKIRQVYDRINDQPGEIPGLTELARDAGMSQSKLSRLFREVYGTTVFACVQTVRLKLAAQMLSQGMSVTETAFSVGYENLSHFSKIFKMQFGKVPSQYKLRN